MLETGELVRGVRTAHVDFERGHTHGPVRVGEEVVQDIENRRLRHDQFLQILRMEIVAVDVDSRQKNRFHLIMAQFVRWLVSSD